MIVVEGPDGSGKTTLIKKLAAHWGLPVADRVVAKDTTTQIDIAAWVDENLRKGWQPTIFDRHRLISEPIYGPILRGENQDPHFLDLSWVWMRVQRFYEIHPLVVYCLPPIGTVRSNVMEDLENDNRAVWDHITPLYSAYVARASRDLAASPRTTMVYDYTADGKELDPLGCFQHWYRIIDARRSW